MEPGMLEKAPFSHCEPGDLNLKNYQTAFKEISSLGGSVMHEQWICSGVCTSLEGVY